MSNGAKSILIRLGTHTILILFLFILQSMVFSRLRIMGIAPLILPVCVVGVALFEGPSWGGGFGLAAGVFCDLSFTGTTVFFTVLLMVIGILIGLLSEYVLARGFPSYLLCSVLTLVVIALFQIFSLLVFSGVSPTVLIQVALAQSLYSLIFILPIYYLTRTVSRKGV